MSYVDKKDEGQKEENKKKSDGLLKTIFSENTMVEDPQDIIDKDPDINRKNAFMKAYEILLALFPEEFIKKKKKKSKEKEEFDRNIAVRQMNRDNLEKKEKQKTKEKEKDERENKGIERGE